MLHAVAQRPPSPSAWMISPGVQVISANTTVEAAVRVRPVPAALMDRIATRTSGCKRTQVTKRRSISRVQPLAG